MTGPAKRKGDSAELEAARLIHDLLGVPARRKLGAGRADDMGDIDGIPDTTVQVCAVGPANLVSRGLVLKPREADAQAVTAGTTFTATFVRIRGGTWRVVLTPEAWATYWREATCPQPCPPEPAPGPDEAYPDWRIR
jgi:hypothetical protein